MLILTIALVGCWGQGGFSHLAPVRSLARPHLSPTSEILPNGWHRYTDEAAGYAISYPPDVWFTISRDKPLEFSTVELLLPPSTGRGNQPMTIIVDRNAESLPRQQFLIQRIYGRLHRGQKIESIPMTEIRLGENTAYQVEIAPYLPALYIFHRDKVYFLVLHADMLAGLPPTPGAREMFFKIAATFTLLEDEGR